MGRLIEESRVVEILQQTWLSGTIAHRFIDDIKRRIRIEVPTVEAIPKADYENRLKADLVAMLEDLDLQIDELYFPQTYPEYMEGRSDCLEEIKELVLEKIDSLKEEMK